ncbi:MAG: type II toxin-antitoxin system RelE/ParE family toxin [Gammaproteobacteria bacterium]|jgi:plasmid stabilization system protein ParE|nr:type II toxin-antitoxin system RelE/ParE family toxin [Gammaproteobacteria bacterium]
MNIRIELAPGVLDDFERILAHLEKYQVPEPEARIDSILAAIDLLQTSPKIGRLLADDKRELVIGTGVQGYVALYCFLAEIKTVLILAVRSQRELVTAS